MTLPARLPTRASATIPIARKKGILHCRHLRFPFPTYMFSNPVMEVNEEGTPYWICPRLVKTIGLFGGVDVKGAVRSCPWAEAMAECSVAPAQE